MSGRGPTPAQVRAKAARHLLNILHRGKTLDQTFGSEPVLPLERELVSGCLRYLRTLSARVDEHLARSLKTRDLDLRCLLIVGAYQLQFTRIPDHAVLSETVSACRALRKPWARGLVNGVLRNLTAGRGGSPGYDPTEQSFELPEWMFERLHARYPLAVLEASLERASMALRINVTRIAPRAYRDQLDAAGLGWRPGYFEESLILESPVPVRELPGYAEGRISVQDPGALFAAPLLDAPRGGRILDACAAPGGKLFHLAERDPTAELTGVEQSAERMAHMLQEARRLGHLQVRALTGDATGRDWSDGEPYGEPYDAILVDAPCSGSGTIRRHPDIKWLREEADLARYQTLQIALLRNLWPLVKPGGALLYCTCSLFEEENDAVIATVLHELDNAELSPLELPTGMATSHGWQLYPLPAARVETTNVDGFYFARIAHTGAVRDGSATRV